MLGRLHPKKDPASSSLSSVFILLEDTLSTYNSQPNSSSFLFLDQFGFYCKIQCSSVLLFFCAIIQAMMVGERRGVDDGFSLLLLARYYQHTSIFTTISWKQVTVVCTSLHTCVTHNLKTALACPFRPASQACINGKNYVDWIQKFPRCYDDGPCGPCNSVDLRAGWCRGRPS